MADKKDEPHNFGSLSSEELFDTGIAQFNNQEYFECHEALEALWNRQAEPEKQFTQGIIQIAVGLYHATRGNSIGANKLLTRGLARVRPFSPRHHQLNIDVFIKSVEPIHEQAIIHEQNALTTPITFPAPKLAPSQPD